jgi:hypothetical protein
VSDIILRAKKQKEFRVPESPGNPTKQQEDADRAMKELLEEKEKEKAAAAVSKEKRQAKADKEHRKTADE